MAFVFYVRSMMFVDCGKTQDCELKLNGECFHGGLNLLGDFGKIR